MPEKKYIYTFAEALEAMKEGKAVKRIGWLGFWKIETPKNQVRNIDRFDEGKLGQQIVMYCKDGSIVFMEQGCKSVFTAENMAENDWMILTDEQVRELVAIRNSRCLAHL